MSRSDHTWLDPLDLTPSHSKPWPRPQSEQLPQPQGCSSLPTSCGHHVTIMPSCITHTTLSVGHLAGGPGPEGPNPLFFQSISILLHANALLIVLQCPHVYLFFDPNSEANCMHPVPCLHPLLLHPHSDSHPSYRCLPDSIPIAYLCLWLCGSIPYK